MRAARLPRGGYVDAAARQDALSIDPFARFGGVEPRSMMSPEPLPIVVGVQISNKHVFSKASAAAIRLIENFGVEGDAHAGATDQHLFHIRRYGQQPNLRQVHLIQSELFDQVSLHGHTVRPGDLGENISTRNLDLLGLPAGARLWIGPAAV